MAKNYVIIGSGIAAVAAAKAIRVQDKEGKIQIFGKEKLLPYNRVLLSKELFSDLESKKVLIKNKVWYKRNNISVFPETMITNINADGRYVVTADGSQIPYDKLLICTGSNNRRLSIEGVEKKGIFTIREIHEAEECKSYIEGKDHIVIIGGGVQGLETAWSFVKAGKKVTIVEAAPRLMPRQLDERTSQLLKNKLEENGVNVYLNASIKSFSGDAEVDGVIINEDQAIACDSVLYSIGVLPNTELAEAASIATNRGIIVDEEMKTNTPDIYASGDAAELNGEVLALWGIALEQGKVAGSNMAGSKISYKKSLPVTIFNAFGMELFSIGMVDERQCEKTIIEDEGSSSYRRVFIKDRRIIGAISLEGVAQSAPYTEAIENQVVLDNVDLDSISISELLGEIKKRQPVIDVKRYICKPCGYIYDPRKGDPDEDVEPGTSFEDLPEDWVCPVCGKDKDKFAEIR